MAPGKFALFKARSREVEGPPPPAGSLHQDPSTESLLHYASSTEFMLGSSIPSTSQTTPEELAEMEMASLRIEFKDESSSKKHSTPTRRASSSSMGETQVNYKQLKNETATDATSTTTLAEDIDQILNAEDLQQASDETIMKDELLKLHLDDDGASTSCDANSLQFDASSIAPSEDISVHCGAMRKPKKSRSKEEQQLRDFDMWRSSNVEVMQHLLSRSGTVDEQIKWEAIATSRGLCTLTDNCACGDCNRAKYLANVSDGDGGLGSAPLFSAISVGCSLQ